MEQANKFANLKVGDEVFVVYQQRQNTRPPTTITVTVTKIVREFGYFRSEPHRDESRFHLKTGYSAHKTNEHNARANYFGFDVYHNEAEYVTEQAVKTEMARLRTRLQGTHASWIIDLPPDAVQKIHAILDEITPAADSP